MEKNSEAEEFSGGGPTVVNTYAQTGGAGLQNFPSALTLAPDGDLELGALGSTDRAQRSHEGDAHEADGDNHLNQGKRATDEVAGLSLSH